PALVHVEHPAAARLLEHGLLGLLLGADEEHRAPARGQVAHERVRLPELLERLLEVDDVDAVALTEDVLLHLGVPALGLVPEAHSGFEQLLHGQCRHNVLLRFASAALSGPALWGAATDGARRV